MARMGDTRVAYGVLVGRRDGKRPLGRRGRRWDDNIKMNLQDVGWRDMDCIASALEKDTWRAVVIKVMSLRVP